MTLATQLNLPPIHEPIVEVVNGQQQMSAVWTKWLNEIYNIISEVMVRGRDTLGAPPTHHQNINFIQLPSHTTTVRDRVANPSDGLIFFNETVPSVQAFYSGTWNNL